jgi:hypothetical protein
MKLYICGRMRGLPNLGKHLFENAAIHLCNLGHDIYNPAAHPAQLADDDEAGWMAIDLPKVCQADAIACLPNWREGRLTHLEIHVAKFLKKPILDAFSLAPLHETVLAEAERLVRGDRNKDYGPPWVDFARTAGMWTALFGRKFEAHEVAMAMICVKLSRLVESPKKRDHWVDTAGYADCGWECVTAQG